MENTTRQYNVLIFPCSETGNTPSSAIHMEVAGDFKMFYEDALKWIRAFHECQTADDRFRIRDGEDDEDLYVCCDEAEVILSLLYCCKDHKVTVREILYQGNRYTDISDIQLSDGFAADEHGLATLSALISDCMRRRTATIRWYIYSGRNSVIFPGTTTRTNSVFSDILSPTAWWK